MMAPEYLSVVIDYAKYLDCPECRKVGLYCIPHRIEVEEILEKYYSKLLKS